MNQREKKLLQRAVEQTLKEPFPVRANTAFTILTGGSRVAAFLWQLFGWSALAATFYLLFG